LQNSKGGVSGQIVGLPIDVEGYGGVGERRILASISTKPFLGVVLRAVSRIRRGVYLGQWACGPRLILRLRRSFTSPTQKTAANSAVNGG
jgi:hypothetical protein